MRLLIRDRFPWLLMLLLLALTVASPGCKSGDDDDDNGDPPGPILHQDENLSPSAAYEWLDISLEATARQVDRVGARPTVIARILSMVPTAMYDAWAAYDDTAVGTRLGAGLRRPEGERNDENREEAIAYAVFRTLLFVFPEDSEWIEGEMTRMGFDPTITSEDPGTPAGVGNAAAAALIDYRRNDGSNQFGDVEGSNGNPYSDYTGYVPVNTVDTINDPDRWQPITFTRPNGEQFTPGYLTPFFHMVKPFALDSADQFRPPGPPKVGSAELLAETDECIFFNANLTPEQKAIVEFMRDGPRSTAQSGHWLRFAQDVSRRDNYGLEEDVKLFFSVGNVCLDAFIACWEAKRFYDSSRPWTLVRHYYAGETIAGWGGPGEGVVALPAQQWHPYSPEVFITPPFPGYPSGHSTASSASATILAHFTGSDTFGAYAIRTPGELTDEPAATTVRLELPTFSATAEMAGISRIMGGYHIQTDNIAGLELGKNIADFSWPKYQAYFNGTATVED